MLESVWSTSRVTVDELRPLWTSGGKVANWWPVGQMESTTVFYLDSMVVFPPPLFFNLLPTFQNSEISHKIRFLASLKKAEDLATLGLHSFMAASQLKLTRDYIRHSPLLPASVAPCFFWAFEFVTLMQWFQEAVF